MASGCGLPLSFCTPPVLSITTYAAPRSVSLSFFASSCCADASSSSSNRTEGRTAAGGTDDHLARLGGCIFSGLSSTLGALRDVAGLPVTTRLCPQRPVPHVSGVAGSSSPASAFRTRVPCHHLPHLPATIGSESDDGEREQPNAGTKLSARGALPGHRSQKKEAGRGRIDRRRVVAIVVLSLVKCAESDDRYDANEAEEGRKACR